MITLVNEYQAVLDTCVLAPMPLADTLLRLAEEPSIFVPRWSQDILTELRRTLLRFGYTEGQADRRVRVMRETFEEAEIIGYEHLIPSMTNSQNDRHVLAAAVRGGAHAIVTQNVKDFPASAVEIYGVEILSPDDFLQHQYHLNSALVMEKIDYQAQMHPDGIDGLLAKLGLAAPSFTTLLREEAA
jgi:predicted nucleic acid-binding protein